MGEHRHAVHPRHAQVEEDEVHPMTGAVQDRQALPAVDALDDVMGIGAESANGPPPGHGLVVADQDAGLFQVAASSTRTWNTIFPGSFVTSIVPPSSRTRCAARASPRPVPFHHKGLK